MMEVCALYSPSRGGTHITVAGFYPPSVYASATPHLYFFFNKIQAMHLLRTGAQDFSCRNVHSSRTAASVRRCTASAPE